MSFPQNEQVDMLKHLKRLTESTVPTDVQVAAGLAALDDAIRNEQFAADLRSLVAVTDDVATAVSLTRLNDVVALDRDHPRRLRWLGAVAAVFVLAVSIAALSLMLGSQPVTALGSIVEAVEILPPDAFGGAYTQRDFGEDRLVVSVFDETPVPVIQPVAITERVDADGNIEITETYGDPILLNPQDGPYLDKVRDELTAGETITTVGAPPDGDNAQILTDSSDDLTRRMRGQYERFGDPSVPYEAYVMDQITSIYLATVPTPTQRAAMISLIDNLPAITQTSTSGGAVAEFEYVGAIGKELLEMRFDNTGWLTGSSLTLIDGSTIDRIPPGTRSSIRLVQPQPFDS